MVYLTIFGLLSLRRISIYRLISSSFLIVSRGIVFTASNYDLLFFTYPLIESIIVKASGWYDISITAKIFMIVGLMPFLFLFIYYGIGSLVYNIKILYKNIFKK